VTTAAPLHPDQAWRSITATTTAEWASVIEETSLGKAFTGRLIERKK